MNNSQRSFVLTMVKYYGLTVRLYAGEKSRGTYYIKGLQLCSRVPNIIKGVSGDLELIATDSQLLIWTSIRISIS